MNTLTTPRTILFFSEFAGFHGGIEQYVFQVAQLLSNNGYRLELLYRDKARDPEKYLSAFCASATSLDKLAFEPDIVIMHRIWDVGIAAELLERYGSRVALIVHDHELYCPRSYYYTPFGRTNCQRAYSPLRCGLCGTMVSPRHWNGGFTSCLRRNFCDFKAKFHLAHSLSSLIVLSDFMRENLIRNGFSPKQIIVLPPPINIPEKCVLPEEGHFKNSPPLIGFVGQLIRGKGADVFLDTLELLKQRGRKFQAVIVGTGADHEMLEERVKASGLDVKMPGFVPSPQEWYERCDMILMPFRWQEPFGLVGAEAAAHGVPVIASALGGVHSWMIPGETGLVAQPGNAVSFAEAVCRLLDEPGLCARLGCQARKASVKMFSRDRFLEGFDKLYGKMSDSDAGVFAVKRNFDGEAVTPRRILVDSLPFDHGQSGISVYTASVIQALQKAGHQVTVLATPADKPYFPDSNVITTPKWAERVIGSILYHVLRMPRLLRKEDYDFCLVTAATRRFPHHSEIPVIGTIHDLAQCRDKKKYGRLRNFYLNHVLARWVRRNATRVVAVSEFSLHEAIKFWRIPPCRIFFSYNGVTLPKREESGFLEQFGLKAGHYILFISRILPQKNHLKLLQAYERLPRELIEEHELVFMGATWHDNNALQEYLQQSPVKEHVHLTGYVADELKPEAFKSASLYVFPSVYEGFGLSVAEAMHYGCPVCCSNNSALGEIGRGAALQFSPEDVDAIRDSMQRVLENRDGIRESLIAAGHAKVGKFSWDIHAAAIVRLYEEAIAEEAKP